MNRMIALFITAGLLCIGIVAQTQQAQSEDMNSTVTKLSAYSIPIAQNDYPNHIGVSVKLYRKGGYSTVTMTRTISETLPPECVQISTITGTELDLTKKLDVRLSYSRTSIYLTLDGYIKTSWTNDTKWQISLLCQRYTPLQFNEDSNAEVAVGALALEPFTKLVEWTNPKDPFAQTTGAEAVWPRAKFLAGSNAIDHICVAWGNSRSISAHEDFFKTSPVWISPSTLENYGSNYSLNPIQCWSPTDNQLPHSSVQEILRFKARTVPGDFDYALIFAVSNNWGFKPLLATNAKTLQSPVFQSFGKLGLRLPIPPAAALTSMRASGKSQKIDVAIVWPKNKESNPILEAEVSAIDEIGLSIVKMVPYGSKSLQIQVPHGGKWTVNGRSGNALAWSPMRTSTIDVSGKPMIKRIVEENNSLGWTMVQVTTPRVGHPLSTTTVEALGYPKPTIKKTFYDCGNLEIGGESSQLDDSCIPLNSKLAASLPSSMLNHSVVAKITAVNSFGEDTIYTYCPYKVQNFYAGGLSIKQIGYTYQLVNKADWGLAKPTLKILDWGVWDNRTNIFSPLPDTSGKSSIRPLVAYDNKFQAIQVRLSAVSKVYGTLELPIRTAIRGN